MKCKLICLLLSCVLVMSMACSCKINGEITPGATEPNTTVPTEEPTGKPTEEPTIGEETMSYWQNTTDFGIHVNENGVMQLAGKDIYIAGTNCYNLFNQCFADFSSAEAKRTLDVLKENGISLVRFNCGGYSYNDLRFYMQNKQAVVVKAD